MVDARVPARSVIVSNRHEKTHRQNRPTYQPGVASIGEPIISSVGAVLSASASRMS
jgi:hypothetical protein